LPQGITAPGLVTWACEYQIFSLYRLPVEAYFFTLTPCTREIGWSLNIIDDSALDLPSAVVRNGRFAPDGPAYKLFAFEGDAYTSTREAVVKWDTAGKIHAIAKTGIPMLIIGNWTVVNSYGVCQ
jgi:hypothetical protein